MAWTDPPTWTAATLTSSQMNQYVSANLTYLKGIADGLSFSGADLSRTAATSINDSTSTAITWSAEIYDYGSWFASGTNIVVPAGAIPSGYTTIAVMVSGRVLFSANSTGYRRLYLLKNGTAFASPKTTAINGDTTDLDVMRITTAVAGDIFTLEVYQNSGGALNVHNSQIACVRYAPVV